MPLWDWSAIETGPTTPGVPDATACRGGVEIWFEFKQTSASAVSFRLQQPPWIHRRTQAGGKVVVAVRRRHRGGPRLGPAVDELWLVRGPYVTMLRVNGLLGMPYDYILGRWGGGPSGWPWPSIEAMLLTWDWS